MYSKFRVSMNEDFSCYYEAGKTWLKTHKSQVKRKLDQFIHYDSGIIDGGALERELFKKINADVFISHSHKDEKLAISFAGWLKANFHLTAFVDSCVWEYADNILSEINDRYNRIRTDANGAKTYSHDKANYAASHIYLMLNSALNNMINKTECFMFIDTDHSCLYMDRDKAKSDPKTLSPWIHSEIVMANTMTKSDPDRFLTSPELRHYLLESMQMTHDLDFSTFIDLNQMDLMNWKHQKKDGIHPLDTLYNLKSKG